VEKKEVVVDVVLRGKDEAHVAQAVLEHTRHEKKEYNKIHMLAAGICVRESKKRGKKDIQKRRPIQTSIKSIGTQDK